MDRPDVAVLVRLHPDGTATTATYPLAGVDLDALFGVLGEPAVEQVASAGQVAQHGAIEAATLAD